MFSFRIEAIWRIEIFFFFFRPNFFQIRNYEEFDIDYEIVQTLGEGGFGRVLLVRNRKRNVQFAMKELCESGPDIHREVELLVTLTRTNPHVVSYFDRFVRTDSNGERKYCIMMDYVRGVNLYDYVKKKKPVNNEILYWFLRSALEALAHMHEMRISHRDIKPENYIVAPYRVDEDGTMVQRLVTIDFGLGSFLKRGGELYKTDAEEIVGTPNYTSPQVIEYDNNGEVWLDAKADDVWALGASFYYLCMGKPIAKHVPGGSWSQSWKEVLEFKCPDVVWPHSHFLNKIITLALSKDHEARPSAQELLKMLLDGWESSKDSDTSAAQDAGTPVASAGKGRKRVRAEPKVAVGSPPPEPAAPAPAPAAAKKKATAGTKKQAVAKNGKPVEVGKARYPLRNRQNTAK